MPIHGIFLPLTVFLLFSLGVEWPVRAAEKSYPALFKVGFSSKVFVDVDARDAQVAMDMYARELNRIVGVETPARASIFMDSHALAEAILRKEVDMPILPALDFLRFEGKVPCEPVFTATNQTGEKQERLLLVRKDGGILRLDLLKGKTVAIPAILRDEVSSLWFESLLAREGLPEMKYFLGSTREMNKASQGIMALFFRQVDAAITLRSVFEIMTQLNPQIGQDLAVIVKSESYLGTISCLHKNLDKDLRQIILERAVKLHEAPNLKQMFTLLQTERIVHFRPDHLENLLELWRQSRNSEKNSAKRR
jgi:ABC-type phosphate/phosphonate transport system substrate-binding protein